MIFSSIQADAEKCCLPRAVGSQACVLSAVQHSNSASPPTVIWLTAGGRRFGSVDYGGSIATGASGALPGPGGADGALVADGGSERVSVCQYATR